jgi:hypothetical protein
MINLPSSRNPVPFRRLYWLIYAQPRSIISCQIHLPTADHLRGLRYGESLLPNNDLKIPKYHMCVGGDDFFCLPGEDVKNLKFKNYFKERIFLI